MKRIGCLVGDFLSSHPALFRGTFEFYDPIFWSYNLFQCMKEPRLHIKGFLLFMTTTQPPPATTTSPKPENSFRDVISLQAIVVTLTIGFLAYIQRDPDFTLKVEIGFLLLVSGPLSGLWRITRAQNETSSGLEHLYTPAVRHYAMQSFLIGMVIVGGAAIGYWAYLLPGQVLIPAP